jgi:hypothetical protein
MEMITYAEKVLLLQKWYLVTRFLPGIEVGSSAY